LSAESTMYLCGIVSVGNLIAHTIQTHTIAFTPRQYLSHIDLNLGCPPRSQLREISATLTEVTSTRQSRDFGINDGNKELTYHLRVTCPFCTRFILKPTVGIELLSECYGQSWCKWNVITAQRTTTQIQYQFMRYMSGTRYLLNGKLAALRKRQLINFSSSEAFPAQPHPNWAKTHRQNPQQRCLASILQPIDAISATHHSRKFRKIFQPWRQESIDDQSDWYRWQPTLSSLCPSRSPYITTEAVSTHHTGPHRTVC